MRANYPAILCLIITCLGCKDPELDAEIFVYGNDFESGDYTGIQGVYISEFDGTKLMGNFNNGGFTLTLEDLPDHEYVRVSFDLYIHDSWDGNSNVLEGKDYGPDLWVLEFDPEEELKSSEKIYFETTFSNRLCVPGWCTVQSYPNGFPYINDARTAAESRSTNGRCLWQSSEIGTSIYKFDRVFPHKRNSTVLSFYDQLTQVGDFPALCDESWSLDNLGVSVLSLK